MGSPEFAVPSFHKIAGSSHQIVAVVTQPDKQKGRGQQLLPTPLKKAALESQISPILQPIKLKDPHFLQKLEQLNADLFVVVAFRILPREVFTIPPKGTINLHPSLLPKYRGAAPINWTIINGETETGLTVIRISVHIDAGEILLQRKVSVYPDETAGSLHDRLSVAGAEVLVEVLNRIAENQITTQPQDNRLATPAPKIRKETCHLNFDQPVEQVKNWIHGLSPYPASFAIYKETMIKFFRARIVDTGPIDDPPGTIVESERGRLRVACNPGVIEILELQREGKRILPAEKFLMGQRLEKGEPFQ